MSAYVDPLFKVPAGRGAWKWGEACHLVADSLDELHAFAKRLGLAGEWFQARKGAPHYDLTAGRRILAVKFGAKELTAREMVERMKAKREEAANA